jgi:hypothetical protein
MAASNIKGYHRMEGEEWVFRGQRHAYNGEEKQKHPKVLKVETQQEIKFSNVGLKKRIKDGGWGE